jgi:hypothetical protein
MDEKRDELKVRSLVNTIEYKILMCCMLAMKSSFFESAAYSAQVITMSSFADATISNIRIKYTNLIYLCNFVVHFNYSFCILPRQDVLIRLELYD